VNACIYPAVLLGAGLLVTLFLMVTSFRASASIYEDVGTDLPAASRLLLEWGQLIDAHTGLMVILTIASVGGAIYSSLTATRAEGRRLGHAHSRCRTPNFICIRWRASTHDRHAAPGGMPAVAALQMSAGLLRAGSRPGICGRYANPCVKVIHSRRRWNARSDQSVAAEC